jgi:HD superfamily phosphodiesterase
MASLLSKLFHYVLLTSAKYSIDESHAVKHSMDVLHFANNIMQSEVPKSPWLLNQERVVYVSAIVHDMCDKKYMNEKQGIRNIEEYLKDDLTAGEMNAVKLIISTMSYSTVKKNGFPELGPYAAAYHVVRESDLLAAYDFDRCMVYDMYSKNSNMEGAFEHAYTLFENRVLKHNEHGLFTTDYAKRESLVLHSQALGRIQSWRNILATSKRF